MTDRTTILSALADQRTALEDTYRAFSEDVVMTPCTDSEDPDGAPWAPIDHLGHLLRIEKAFLGMARLTVQGDENPIKIGGSSWEEKIAQVHRDNENHLASLRPLDVETLLSELAGARQDTVGFIAELSDEQLTTPIPGAPWGDGTIGGVLMANAGHERQHLAWVADALA